MSERGTHVVQCARCRAHVDFADSFLGAPWPLPEDGMLCRECFSWDSVFGLRPTGADALIGYGMVLGATWSEARDRWDAIPNAAVLRLRALSPRRFDPEFVSADEWGV